MKEFKDEYDIILKGAGDDKPQITIRRPIAYTNTVILIIGGEVIEVFSTELIRAIWNVTPQLRAGGTLE